MLHQTCSRTPNSSGRPEISRERRVARRAGNIEGTGILLPRQPITGRRGGVVVSGRSARRLRRVGAALLIPALLGGCSLLPGPGSTGEPGGQPSPAAPASAPTSAVPTSALPPRPAPVRSRPPRPARPSRPCPMSRSSTFPTVAVPTADPTEKGLRVRQTTIRGRSAGASWTISIPVFSGAPVAKEVNRRVRAAANDLIAQVRREAKDDAGAKRTLTGVGTVVTNDRRTIQVTIIFSDYLAGTAHPANAVTTTVIDVGKARPVLLTQVIQNPPEGLRFLKAQVVKAAKKKREPVDKAGLAPKVANWANWQTTPAGMTFYFGDYQLGDLRDPPLHGALAIGTAGAVGVRRKTARAAVARAGPSHRTPSRHVSRRVTANQGRGGPIDPRFPVTRRETRRLAPHPTSGRPAAGSASVSTGRVGRARRNSSNPGRKPASRRHRRTRPSSAPLIADVCRPATDTSVVTSTSLSSCGLSLIDDGSAFSVVARLSPRARTVLESV